MNRAVRLVAWVLVFASIGATAAAWVVLARDRPELDADDAADVALGTLADAGIEGTVTEPPTLVEHQPEQGDALRAWSVLVEVDGGVVELRVREDAGQLVYVDDNVGDGERLLDDEQFARIGAYRDDELLETARHRNIVATGATVFIAVVGYIIAKRPRPAGSAP